VDANCAWHTTDAIKCCAVQRFGLHLPQHCICQAIELPKRQCARAISIEYCRLIQALLSRQREQPMHSHHPRHIQFGLNEAKDQPRSSSGINRPAKQDWETTSSLQMSRAGADGDVDGASKKPRVAENEKNENEHVVSMMQMVRGA
jgi:hypothetical protein